jgi:hypothetical protein
MPAFFEKNSVGEQGDFTDCGAQVEIYSEIGSSSGDDFRDPDGSLSSCGLAMQGNGFRMNILSRQQNTNVMGDAAILIGGDDLDPDRTRFLGDHGGVAMVRLAVDRNAEESELPADLLAHGGRVLADAASKDERVEPVEDRSVTGGGLRDGAAEDGDGLTCRGGTLIGCGGELAKIGDAIGQAC